MIGPNSEQLALRDSIRDALADQCPSSLVRAAMSDPASTEPVWRLAVDLGWTALAARTIDDELGLSTLDLVLTLEECGAALAPIPMVTSVGMAAAPLQAAAGEGPGRALADIAEGEVAALAAHVPGSRIPGVPMTLEGDRVHGVAVGVAEADRAKKAVTLCRDSDGAVFVVVLDRDRLRVTAGDSVDPSRPLATIEVDGVPDMLAPVDVEAALAPALLAQAAELVGVARAVLNLAVEHAKSRVQFGKPIGSYQGVKHGLADSHVAVERARSLTYTAANAIDDGEASVISRWTAAALAKAAASDAAVDCARTAVQILGALGQTWEHDAHLYLRRAWLGASQLGDSKALYHLEGRRFMRAAS